jgi:hypothetical protein
MAEPITITETVFTGYSPAEAQDRLVAHFGPKVRRNEPGMVMVRTGSQLAIRVLGAYLMPRRWMPTKLIVSFTASGSGCDAAVTCADDFGFGLRVGMRGRYQSLLHEKMEEVRAVLLGMAPAL